MNNKLFSLHPSITTWPFSTTSDLPSRKDFMLNWTASTTNARTTEKYRIPTITMDDATARLAIVDGTTPELKIPVLIPVIVKEKCQSCVGECGCTVWATGHV